MEEPVEAASRPAGGKAAGGAARPAGEGEAGEGGGDTHTPGPRVGGHRGSGMAGGGGPGLSRGWNSASRGPIYTLASTAWRLGAGRGQTGQLSSPKAVGK